MSGRPSQEDLSRGLQRRPGGLEGVVLPSRPMLGTYVNEYRVDRILRKGVCQATHKATSVARHIREIRKPHPLADDDRTQYLVKLDTLLPLDHPHILKLAGLYEDAHSFYLATDIPQGGDLLPFVLSQNRLTERTLATILIQVLGGLQFLHKKKVLHKDLRPSKIVLKAEANSWERARLALSDYGTSGSLSDVPSAGSLPFAPPESFFMEFSEKSDMWSAGCVLYVLVAGALPFCGKDDFDTRLKIETQDADFGAANWTVVSGELKNYVGRLLAKDPNKRPTATEALTDPWLMTYARPNPDGVSEPQLNLRALTSFTRELKLMDAVSAFTSVPILSREELEKLSYAYSVLDTDKDEAVTRADLITGLTQLVSKEEATAWIATILAKNEQTPSGPIPYPDIVTACATIGKELAAKDLKIAFKTISIPLEGKILAKELKGLMGKGVVANEGIWGKLVGQLERSRETEVDAGDFVDRMVLAYS